MFTLRVCGYHRCLAVKLQNCYVDKKNVSRASIDVAVSSKWVRFQYWANYPFSLQ